MLKNQSGDLVKQLQAKIAEMQQYHEKTVKQMENQHASEKHEMKTSFDQLHAQTLAKHQEEVKTLERTKQSEFDQMKAKMQA